MSTAVDRHHYLAALGIDVWVRRSLRAPAAEVGDPEAPTPEGAADAGPGQTRASAPEAAGPAPGVTADEAPAGAARSARALLDVVESGEAGAAADAPPAAPEVPPASARTGAGVDETGATPAPGAAAAVPEFRLTILTLGGAMALVDEAALGDDRGARTRLGDLLRVARRLRCGDASGRLELRTFFWPQVEGDAVDQGPEAAAQALAAFARRHTEADDGLLVLVEPAADAPARAPLLGLETLPRARARIPAAFVRAPGAEAARAAWSALVPLGRTDAT